MQDFAERFGERARAAREVYKRQVEETGRAKTASLAATDGLLRHAEQRFLWVAAASKDDIRYDAEADPGGALVQRLTWVATKPQRSLQFRADQANGGAWWAWAYDGGSTDWREVDLETFGAEDIDALIILLADQETWGRGDVPEPPPSGGHRADPPQSPALVAK